ncbi:MAG: hypothetical protein NTW86_18670, partial [Candidatus Sumerlaeota bacterium]|nr:hypothetical protein [Candidatus Sumerlaeota bacterium]
AGSGQAADTVVVSSPQVEKPAAVRYAWAAFPECALYNKEGLPAAPFRTDDWALEKAATSRPAPKAAPKAAPTAKPGSTAKAGATAKPGPTAKPGATAKPGPTAKTQ